MEYSELFEKIKYDKISNEQAKSELEKIYDRYKNGLTNAKVKSKINRLSYDDCLLIIKEILSPILKIPVERMNEDEEFEQYGINSVLAVRMSEELEKTFGKLSKTLLYEHRNLRELTQYFLQEKSDILGRKINNKTIEQNNNLKDIAIIGISGCYACSNNIYEFWNNLREGVDCIKEIPLERWDFKKYYCNEKGKESTILSKWGGFINGMDEFDPSFFNISPIEAERMDPQERLLLEYVYEALEDASYTKQLLKKYYDSKVGVYVGVMNEEYSLYGVQEQILGNPIAIGGNTATLANRISYFFDFNGPSMSINSMCSSSLTALHLACQSIIENECKIAIVAGINVIIHPNKYLSLTQGKFLAENGRCESFGKGGSGYVPSEGVGVFILKPLSYAVEDRDNIYGVIKGTAINHAGKTHGFTVPNPNMQAEVIENAIRKSDINPRTITYIEAHGTGTVLGDPIEIKGLEKTFKKYSDDKHYCHIGSVKSNIGHCEGAAGMASMTKVLLQMKYKLIAPSLHTEVLNPNIDFDDSPFIVQKKLEQWEDNKIEINGTLHEYPRRAGVSAFGAGGSNAHVILEEYKYKEGNHYDSYKEIPIIISAPTKDRLLIRCKCLLEALVCQRYKDEDLLNISYTLQVGREEMKIRVGFVVNSIEELVQRLKDVINDKKNLSTIYYGDLNYKQLELDDNVDFEHTHFNDIRNNVYDLIKLWVSGKKVQWERVYFDKYPRRISVPTTPFRNKRYWYKNKNAKKELMYKPVWKKWENNNYYYDNFVSKQVLIVFDKTVIHTKKILEEYLIKKQNTVNSVSTTEIKDCDALLDKNLDVIFFLGGLYNHNDITDYNLDNETSLLYLFKKVKQDINKKYKIYIISHNKEKVGEETISPIGGGIIGLTYAAAQSSSNLEIHNIDFTYKDKTELDSNNMALENIFRVPSSNTGELFKISDANIYRLNFEKIGSYNTTVFSREGVYIIVGGAGTIGRIISKSLIEKYKCNIAWIGRKKKDSDKVQSAILSVSNNGVTPFYVEADITQYDEIEKAINKIKEKFGKIKGVIFSVANLVINNTINNTGDELLVEGFKAKALGSINCYKALEKENLDFLCFFSSAQAFSFSGAGNLCTYAASITFSDTYAKYLCSIAKFPIGIINWGFWKASSSKEFGNNLKDYIENDDGIECFEKFIFMLTTKKIEQIVCMNMDNKNNNDICDHKYNIDFLDNKLNDQYREEIETIVLKLLSGELDLIRQENIIEEYIPWLQECKNILKEYEANLIEEEITFNIDNLWEQWKIFKEKYIKIKDYKSQILLVETCLKNLQGILLGEKRAIDVIFPDSSMKMLEGIYSGNSVADFYNEIVANEIEKFIIMQIKNKEKNKFSIVEVGAGIGGTTETILRKLEKYSANITYIYTDISTAFLDYACKKFEKYNFNILYKKWNVEEEFPEKDIMKNIDIVVATNVIHATQNIASTLNNIKGVLKEKGLLVINELVKKDLITTITFGLLNGWWRANDREMRISGSPLLESNQWLKILHTCEFKDVQLPLFDNQYLTQQIFIAQKNSYHSNFRDIFNLTELDTSIKQMLSNTLKMDINEIDSNTPFNEYGLDSILGGKFINQINEKFKMKMDQSILFDYSTCNLLCQYISKMKKSDKFENKEVYIVQENSSSDRTLLSDDKIAVVGMSGQFPGATNVENLWSNLINNRNSIIELPLEYLDQKKYFAKNKEQGKTYCKYGGILENKYDFDSLFFSISPRDKNNMNPHQSLVLQESWKAIEDAGYNPKDLFETSTCVYIGAEPTNKNYGSFIGSSDAIISSRLSYFLNLQGPALTINTGCSSSAVAIHLGCEELRNRKVNLAIAGGVYANLNEEALIALSEIEMLSHSGQCYALDNRADGTIMSEAVGIVVLKRLKDAIEDGDAIYGIISASGMNQDGASNGITAPNGLAQEKLMKSVYSQYNINKKNISYIEMHGTGTKLGDPVEFNALKRVYSDIKREEDSCLLGSIKANIGHTGAASGVVSLIKILLCMKYKKIPALCNLQKLNESIDLKNTCFAVNKHMMEWKNDEESPLMAALNSFGHSGTNVHFVIEEYLNDKTSSSSNIDIFIIPLSAKSEDALQRYSYNLMVWLEDQIANNENIELDSLSYTLQNGREQFDFRVLFIVRDVCELITKLKNFVDGIAMENCWKGKISSNQKLLSLIDNEDSKRLISKWLGEKNYKKIGQAWTNGLKIEWDELYKSKPNRLHLPTYPFQTAIVHNCKLGTSISFYKDRENGGEVIYNLELNGSEYYVKEHCVNGKNILPASGYLKIIAEVSKDFFNSDEKDTIFLKNIVWLLPLSIDKQTTIKILLKQQHSFEFFFQIYSCINEKKNVYCQGVCGKNDDLESNYANIIQDFRVNHIKQIIYKDECYKTFAEAGFQYGNSFNCIREIQIEKNKALAEIVLNYNTKFKAELLHPGIVDAAFQAAATLIGTMEGKQHIKVPYAVEKIVVYRPIEQHSWVYVKKNQSSNAMDILLLNGRKEICIELKSLVMKSLNIFKNTHELLIMLPKICKTEINHEKSKHFQKKYKIITDKAYQKVIKEVSNKNVNHIILKTDKNLESEMYIDYAVQLINEVKMIMKTDICDQIFLELILLEKEEFCIGLQGILRTAEQEYLGLNSSVVLCKTEESMNHYLNNTNENNNIVKVDYTWSEIKLHNIAQIPWKNESVIVIVGGKGNLGMVFTEDIIDKVQNATIIWIGKSTISDIERTKINNLIKNQIEIVYYEADITKQNEIEDIINDIVENYKSIDIIIYAAGYINDKLIENADISQSRKVLETKVKGIWNLHKAVHKIPIKSFIICSSISGILGNLGQANYSAANAYLDFFAEYRNKLVKKGDCFGKTISLDWGLWNSKKMITLDSNLEKMYRQTGMTTLGINNALKALYYSFEINENQIVVVEGSREKMIKTIFNS